MPRAEHDGYCPIPPRGGPGGERPGHVWILHAGRPYRCEGLNPFGPKPLFARDHHDIAAGDRFLRKLWIPANDNRRVNGGLYVTTRHCERCASVIAEEIFE